MNEAMAESIYCITSYGHLKLKQIFFNVQARMLKLIVNNNNT